jgi:GTPase SAR1 family protein
MKIIIIGPAQSGKTTLLHKIIRTNPNIAFPLILDKIGEITPWC